jgi:hypothetical protein
MALDAGQDVLEVIQAAGARQDRASLRAMRDELPAYLDAHRMSGPLYNATMAALDLAEGPLLGPVEKYARDLQTEMALGLQKLTQAANMAKYEAAGSDEYGYLPNWSGGAVNVAEQGPQA